MRDDETKLKIRLSQPKRREVIVDGQTYDSVRYCARMFGISSTQVLWRIKHWENWNYNDKL